MRAELDLSFIDEDDSRRIDDPVRMYLTQMGEIPLLKREQEIALAKKIEVTRKRFRRKVLECDGALRQVVDTLKRVHCRRPALRPHGQGVADREPRKRQDPPAHAAQPEDARTPDGAERQDDFSQASRSARRRGGTTQAAAAPCASAAARPSRSSRNCRIRTQKVQPLMKKLEQISARMDELEQQIEDLKGDAQLPRKTGPTWKKNCTTT